MTTYTPTRRRSAGLLAATAAAAAAITATIGTAPPAQATCASFWGLGNSADCKSTLFSMAIAIGDGATAVADSVFGAAVALGNSADAVTSNPFAFAVTAGDQSSARGNGLFAIALNLGNHGHASTGGSADLGNLGFNIAVDIVTDEEGSGVQAFGVGNVAANIFGYSETLVSGVLNTALNVGGSGVSMIAGGDSGKAVFNTAINVLGSNNDVVAGPGPLALAGSFFQTNADTTQSGPGFNINGIKVGAGAATRHPARAAAKPASARAPHAATSTKTKAVSAARARR